MPGAHSLCDEYEEWIAERGAAAATGTMLKPFVAITITCNGWKQWCSDQRVARDISSIRHYANDLVEKKIRVIMEAARERLPSSIIVPRYVIAVTEEIGQDRANDVSHIASIIEMPNADPVVRDLVVDARMFHEHALAVA